MSRLVNRVEVKRSPLSGTNAATCVGNEARVRRSCTKLVEQVAQYG